MGGRELEQEGRKAKFIPEIIFEDPRAFAMLALLIDDDLFRRLTMQLAAQQAYRGRK